MGICIVHIGMHKTGSTSIQESLNGFEDERFVYAGLGPANHSLPIYSLFGRSPNKHHLFRHKSRKQVSVYVRRTRELLKAAVDKSKGKTLIISGEDISILNRDELARLRDYLSRDFDQIKIIGYVRSPLSYMNSAFQQVLKGGRWEFDLDRIYVSYRGRFEKFDAVFDDVELIKFDPGRFPDRCVVRDFCRRIGLEFPAERIVRVNESMSRQVAKLLYMYRKYGGRYDQEGLWGEECQRLIAYIEERLEKKEKFRIAGEAIWPVLERNREDIAWMETRLGERLDEVVESREGDIRSEQDLLAVEPELVEVLRRCLGERMPEGMKAVEKPQQVARLVHWLRCELGLWGVSPHIQRVEDGRVVGYVLGGQAERPVRVSLWVDGAEVGRTVANKIRPGLKKKGLHPTGKCGFVFKLPEGLQVDANTALEVKVVGVASRMS